MLASFLILFCLCKHSYTIEKYSDTEYTESLENEVTNSKVGDDNDIECDSMTRPTNIPVYNKYWQKLKFDWNYGDFHLWKAFYDDRSAMKRHHVRILSMTKRKYHPPIVCYLWHDNQKVAVRVKAHVLYGWRRRWGRHKDRTWQFALISCAIPNLDLITSTKLNPGTISNTTTNTNANETSFMNSTQITNSNTNTSTISIPNHGTTTNTNYNTKSIPIPIPSYVSIGLRSKNCKIPLSNMLKVEKNEISTHGKKKFAVCMKGLDFPDRDMSTRLIEWIEMVKILGGSKIFLYDLHIHPNMSKVIDHYVKKGDVTLTKLTLPGNQPNGIIEQHKYLEKHRRTKMQNEMLPHNDCLYRNINSFQYLVILDLDEIIVPRKSNNWYELIAMLENEGGEYDSYSAICHYFLDTLSSNNTKGRMADEVNATLGDNIPKHLHMFKHIYAKKVIPITINGRFKSFHNLDRMVSKNILFLMFSYSYILILIYF